MTLALKRNVYYNVFIVPRRKLYMREVRRMYNIGGLIPVEGTRREKIERYKEVSLYRSGRLGASKEDNG